MLVLTHQGTRPASRADSPRARGESATTARADDIPPESSGVSDGSA
ncbi:hypothetical protein PR003_g30598 [Phytophthora rubi]|uniref:Uncharacterized protein n=1 Tax=Phytophthora rubi TaxID=129364 RepID=A0A6A4BD13_9STRA|nr:hypothetical protein PR003_g30598 [Phytophthora rubi]